MSSTPPISEPGVTSSRSQDFPPRVLTALCRLLPEDEAIAIQVNHKTF